MTNTIADVANTVTSSTTGYVIEFLKLHAIDSDLVIINHVLLVGADISIEIIVLEQKRLRSNCITYNFSYCISNPEFYTTLEKFIIDCLDTYQNRKIILENYNVGASMF